jgi:hypothetical protein
MEASFEWMDNDEPSSRGLVWPAFERRQAVRA